MHFELFQSIQDIPRPTCCLDAVIFLINYLKYSEYSIFFFNSLKLYIINLHLNVLIFIIIKKNKNWGLTTALLRLSLTLARQAVALYFYTQSCICT